MSPPADTGIPLHEDNQGPIKMANTRLSSQRTRHIDVKHHVVRDAIDSAIIRVESANLEEQDTDLNRALDANNFEGHTRFLMNGS